MSVTVTGVVDNIKYRDGESGYSVVRILPTEIYSEDNRRDGTVIVVGVMPDFREGETAVFVGDWQSHKKYGMQFNAETAYLALPRTEEEIAKYLCSGQFKGIGPGAAEAIVTHFGEATIEILDEEPSRLYSIETIKPAVAERFLKDWSESHVQRHTLTYLQQELGISARISRRLYGKYGSETRRLVKADPYRLANDELLSFADVDRIAQKLGIDATNLGRVLAGFAHTLHQFSRNGHTFAPRTGAIAEAGRFLKIEDRAALEAMLDEILTSENLIEEAFNAVNGGKPTRAIYLPKYWHAENRVAEKLRSIAMRSSSLIHRRRSTNWSEFLDTLGSVHNLQQSAEQLNAVRAAMTSKVSVLTGGPGTGKTTTLRLLIEALRQSDCAFHIATPTGRAARRLSDATGNPASTIHRLLKWEPNLRRFTLNEGNVLQTDFVIIDEASMLDLMLFKDLLVAMPIGAHLLLVGDVDQLPSVGAGNVLRDVIDCEFVKVTRLNQIYRQGDASDIVHFAHLINQGSRLEIDNGSSDFFFFRIPDSAAVADMIVDLVMKRIPRRWSHFDQKQDIQVIAPMYDGDMGVNNLNDRLQRELTMVASPEIRIGRRVFRVGDKVMQTRNDYDKEVFNGDIGFIKYIDSEARTLRVRFEHGSHHTYMPNASKPVIDDGLAEFLELPSDSDLIKYEFSELDDLALAYCITIHKSQGSEFPVVVMPVHPQQSRMLQRNLIYTAITRARRLVVLVGTRYALQLAVDNNKVAERHSGLKLRLMG